MAKIFILKEENKNIKKTEWRFRMTVDWPDGNCRRTGHAWVVEDTNCTGGAALTENSDHHLDNKTTLLIKTEYIYFTIVSEPFRTQKDISKKRAPLLNQRSRLCLCVILQLLDCWRSTGHFVRELYLLLFRFQQLEFNPGVHFFSLVSP